MIDLGGGETNKYEKKGKKNHGLAERTGADVACECSVWPGRVQCQLEVSVEMLSLEVIRTVRRVGDLPTLPLGFSTGGCSDLYLLK